MPSGEAEEVVKYGYQGDKVPEKITPDEVVEKRTENSYTREMAVENKGTKDEKIIFESVFYSQPTFSKEGDDWYYIEHATTSESAFNAFRKENALATLFIPKAHADSITPFSGAGDGWVENQVQVDDCGTQWSTTHDAATGFTFSSTATTLSVRSSSFSSTFLSLFLCTIDRVFLPFDTSSIPGSATISAATLNVYAVSKTNTDNDGTDFLTVTQTSQATHTVLANADYDQCGAISNPTEGIDSGQRKDITSVTTSAYLIFTLNSTGMGWIKKSGQASACTATTGVTCLGIREGHDVTNSAIISGFDVVAENLVSLSSSEQTGTSQDPYLSVTYSTGQPVLWQMWEF